MRSSEASCPFCASALPEDLAAKAVPGTTQRLSRAAAFTFAATLAATGCGPTTTSEDSGTVADNGGGGDTGATSDNPASTDRPVTADVPVAADLGVDSGFLAMYGGPPDSGMRTDSGAPDDNGGIVPLYGLARDAGSMNNDVAPSDDGSVMALYGAVPADSGAEASVGVRYGSPPRPDAG